MRQKEGFAPLETMGRQKRELMLLTGFTLVEIMIVVGVIALLAAIVIPHLLRARINTDESSVRAALKTIATAEVTYRISNNAYASLKDLGSPAAGPAYIDKVLGCNSEPCNKSGYQFSSSDITTNTFHCSAIPLSNATGIRSYCVTEDGLTRVDPNGGAITDYNACKSLNVTVQ
jgi:type IV pilus assembly protein PilA